jgi:3,4-dihydroxy 2-butanone 4-phosphate synthase/GTP cyclohydrolase II
MADNVHDIGEARSPFASIDEIIADARAGRLFVLVDDERRENEGDLVIAADKATPEAVNFMARYGRGLICLALTAERAAQLRLEPMQRRNTARFDTAFTVSIEAKEGISTGISAPDRARTISVAIDRNATAEDLATPGHVFPVVAREGGVLVRAGHTEAAVDIARLAGLTPAGVICEIMNDDGTMARRSDLIGYCRRHGLRIGTISELIAYRRRHDRLVARRLERDFDSRHGGRFRMVVYANTLDDTEHVALIKGDIDDGRPVLVRVHKLDLVADLLGEAADGRGRELHAAMDLIGREGRGVIVLIGEDRPHALSDRLSSAGALAGSELRDIGLGSQILLDLGVRAMCVLSNSERTIVGLDGFGLEVAGWRPIPTAEG